MNISHRLRGSDAILLILGSLGALAAAALSSAGQGLPAAFLSLLSLAAFILQALRARKALAAIPPRARRPSGPPPDPAGMESGILERAGLDAERLDDILEVVPAAFEPDKGPADPAASAVAGALASAAAPGMGAATPEAAARLDAALGKLTQVISFADQVVMDVSSSSMGLEAFTGMQASSIEQVSSAIRDMDQALHEVADHAARRRNSAEGLMDVVRSGGKEVAATNKRMELIDKDLARIRDVADLIDDIAERTRLLGMNAAIEAAHAGAAGRGFQVIAGEIRKLSDSTTSNSRSIAESVVSISGAMRQALAASSESARTFLRIDAEVRDFIQSLGDIADSMGKLSSVSNGLLSDVSAVGEVTQSIRDNASAMKESSERIERSLDQVKSEFGQIRNLSSGGGGSAEGSLGSGGDSAEVDKAMEAFEDMSLDGDELFIPDGGSS